MLGKGKACFDFCKVNPNVEPNPSVLLTLIVCSCASTICLTIASPKPEPPICRDLLVSVLKNRSNSLVRYFSSIPIPSSVTSTSTWSCNSNRLTDVFPSSFPYLKELSIRLTSTCRIFSRSAFTSICSSYFCLNINLMLCWRAFSSTDSKTSFIRSFILNRVRLNRI
jgi:hypothetical protein